MIELSANISKKVPIPAQQFSSQQFGAQISLQLSDADAAQPEAIQGRIRDLYTILSQSVDEQIAGAAQQPASGYQSPAASVVPIRSQPVPIQTPPIQQPRNGYVARNRIAAVNGNGTSRASSNGQPVLISQAQIRAVHAIAKSLNISVTDVLARHNLSEITQVPMRTASLIIDKLKALQNGNGATTQA